MQTYGRFAEKSLLRTNLAHKEVVGMVPLYLVSLALVALALAVLAFKIPL